MDTKTQDTFAAFTGVELEVVAMALALAIQPARKFGAAKHKVAMTYIIGHSKPASLAENLQRIGNVSAVRQELEKAGLVDGSISALARQTGDALDQLAKAAKKAA